MTEISLSNLKIQLVEPSAMQAEVVRRMLEEMGVHRIHHFDSAGAALTEMRTLRPDAVISSLYLPDMPGTELVAAMRKDEDLEWLPFILISSETRPQMLNPVRQSGACCIIAKPFTAVQMQRALHAVVDQLAGIEQIDGDDVDNLKVLLVDDSAMSRHHIRHLLESMGIERVVEAENGREAIPLLADTVFDLVLTDYNMPEMDGRALVEYIRTQSWQTEVPVLMLTSENNEGRLAAVEKAGVSAICDKPFDGGSIRELIVNALRG